MGVCAYLIVLQEDPTNRRVCMCRRTMSCQFIKQIFADALLVFAIVVFLFFFILYYFVVFFFLSLI